MHAKTQFPECCSSLWTAWATELFLRVVSLVSVKHSRMRGTPWKLSFSLRGKGDSSSSLLYRALAHALLSGDVESCPPLVSIVSHTGLHIFFIFRMLLFERIRLRVNKGLRDKSTGTSLSWEIRFFIRLCHSSPVGNVQETSTKFKKKNIPVIPRKPSHVRTTASAKAAFSTARQVSRHPEKR